MKPSILLLLLVACGGPPAVASAADGGSAESDCSFTGEVGSGPGAGQALFAVVSMPGLDPANAPELVVLGCTDGAPAPGVVSDGTFTEPTAYCSPADPTMVLIAPGQAAVVCGVAYGANAQPDPGVLKHYRFRLVSH